MCRKRKKPSLQADDNLLYRGQCMVDVTYFDAMTADDSLGYLAGGIACIFKNGDIAVYDMRDVSKILEIFSIKDILDTNNNIIHPDKVMSIAVITKHKAISFTFRENEEKNRFWNALQNAYKQNRDLIYGKGINVYTHFVDGMDGDGNWAGGYTEVTYYPKVHKAIEKTGGTHCSNETIYDVPKDMYDIETVKKYLKQTGVYFEHF